MGCFLISFCLGNIGLPFADGLPADAQSGTQLLLRNIQLFSIQADALSKCHIAFSFHRGYRWNFDFSIPYGAAIGYHPAVNYRLRAEKRPEFQQKPVMEFSCENLRIPPFQTTENKVK